MLKYFGFVMLLEQVNRAEPAGAPEARNRKARRAAASATGASDVSIGANLFGPLRHMLGSLAHWAGLAQRELQTRDNERVLRENFNRLSRLSPHLLDDIGLLPVAGPDPTITLTAKVSELDAARGETASPPVPPSAPRKGVATGGHLVATAVQYF